MLSMTFLEETIDQRNNLKQTSVVMVGKLNGLGVVP